MYIVGGQLLLKNKRGALGEKRTQLFEEMPFEPLNTNYNQINGKILRRKLM